MRILKNKKGEGYVDVAVTIMLVSFVLVFMVNVVSLVALNQNLKTAADQIVEYAAVNGSVDISGYIAEQQEKLGVDFDWTFDGSAIGDNGKVQLGETIQCTLTKDISFMGFGEAVHLTTVSASAKGLSRVYWK